MFNCLMFSLFCRLVSKQGVPHVTRYDHFEESYLEYSSKLKYLFVKTGVNTTTSFHISELMQQDGRGEKMANLV